MKHLRKSCEIIQHPIETSENYAWNYSGKQTGGERKKNKNPFLDPFYPTYIWVRGGGGGGNKREVIKREY